MGFLKAQPYWVRDTHIESVGGEHEITIVARPISSVWNLLIWRFKSTKNWEMNFDLAVDPFNGSWKEPYVSKEIFQGMYHQQHTGFSKKFDRLRSHHMDTHCSGYFKESGVRDSHASTDRYEPSWLWQQEWMTTQNSDLSPTSSSSVSSAMIDACVCFLFELV